MAIKFFHFWSCVDSSPASAGKMDIGGKIRLSLDYIGTRYCRNWKETTKDSDKDFWAIFGERITWNILCHIANLSRVSRYHLEGQSWLTLETRFRWTSFYFAIMTKYQNADIFGTCACYWYNLIFIFKIIFILTCVCVLYMCVYNWLILYYLYVVQLNVNTSVDKFI